ncbi:four helix bundle protein [Galbibacter mesophilus]|uniref:four helix bundle protein n=1 Tax=Galbibacter mesophilus TaxID=379069 RepID=UPI00191FC387|nr:four helix bundle protein [Galbibacter mesophilus]MCM5662302.1 four helix bundle protein [Galbibacter mesophilus]
MGTIKQFEDLEIWQEARRLTQEIIKIVKTTHLNGDFKLRDQIKGSSGSVMDNIAEGFERDGNIEFRQFLSIAKGSAGETRSQLYRVYDSSYISEEKLNELVKDYKKLSQRIAAFINYLNRKEYKGIKYKE